MTVQDHRIAIGSDERTALTEAVVATLRNRGFQLQLYGALASEPPKWAVMGRTVAKSVANKVPADRAALCADAETAAGARKWNAANILCMSLWPTSPAVAEKIVNTWLSTNVERTEAGSIEIVKEMDRAASSIPASPRAATTPS